MRAPLSVYFTFRDGRNVIQHQYAGFDQYPKESEKRSRALSIRLVTIRLTLEPPPGG